MDRESADKQSRCAVRLVAVLVVVVSRIGDGGGYTGGVGLGEDQG